MTDNLEMCMGMGFPMGMGIPWDSHGNGTKNLISHGSGNGNENHVDGNGNDRHSHENSIPIDNRKRTVLYSIAFRILCMTSSSAASECTTGRLLEKRRTIIIRMFLSESTNSLLFLRSNMQK